MTLFYKSTSVVGGGKLYYGSKEVKKLYLKDKLVYESILPVGTVISSEPLSVTSNSSTNIIETINVNSDWSNVSSNVIFNFKTEGTTFKRSFTKEELFQGGTVYTHSGNTYYYVEFKIDETGNIVMKHRTTNGLEFYSATLV